jgi:hypothetical protein
VNDPSGRVSAQPRFFSPFEVVAEGLTFMAGEKVANGLGVWGEVLH